MSRATVTIRNVETNISRDVATNDRGIYVATLLPVGRYELRARALGYGAETREGIVLRLGQTVEVPFTLTRRAVDLAEVRVTAAATLVDATRVEAATQLSDEVVSGLPNNGRNYLNLTLLTPNVAIVTKSMVR